MPQLPFKGNTIFQEHNFVQHEIRNRFRCVKHPQQPFNLRSSVCECFPFTLKCYICFNCELKKKCFKNLSYEDIFGGDLSSGPNPPAHPSSSL